jgi:hypothetical protein
MSQENKDMLKHALVSVLVGAIVSFLTVLLQGLLNVLQNGQFDFAGPVSSMIYYFKGRKMVA